MLYQKTKCGKSVVHDIIALKLHFSNIGLEQNAKLIGELILVYSRDIKRYKIDLEQNVYYGKTCDVSTKELDQLFNFDPNVIFLEGDKNVGFVCKNT